MNAFKTLFISAFIVCSVVGTIPARTAFAEEIDGEVAKAILAELRQIRETLQKMEKQGTTPAAQPRQQRARPTTASISTLGNPVLGDENAPVTLVEFTDYQCPYCRRFYQNTLAQIKEKYIDTGKLKLVLRDLPLAFHADARGAAQATHCAGEQEQYWPMHDALFESRGGLKQKDLIAHAQSLSLDTEDFQKCIESTRYLADIDKDIADARKVRITGTPTFVIGKSTSDIVTGIRLVGTKPFADFETQIESLLKITGS